MSSPAPPRHPRRRRAAVLIAGLLAVVLAAAALAALVLVRDGRLASPSAQPSATVPAFGIMAWRANSLGPADFALIRSSGARLYRFNLTTSTTGDREPRAPTEKYDRLMRAGAAQGIDFLPVLLRSRPRLRPSPKQVAAPPRSAREIATWRARVRFYAARYGPGGRFWRENPGVPYRPIRVWEVWNEPNLRQFWERKPDAREYGRLLRLTRGVLRGVDPQARILSAGLSARYRGAAYLRELLAEAGPCAVDAIGIHPYSRSAARSMRFLAAARAAADAKGVERVPLWTTEIGWRVGGRGSATVPTAAVQARELARFAAATTRRRRELRLGPVLAFALRDRVSPNTGRVDRTDGLRRANDTPRPAWGVWARAARGAPRLALPRARRCGR